MVPKKANGGHSHDLQRGRYRVKSIGENLRALTPAATSIDAGAAQNVRLYGSTMANQAAGVNVTFLTGAARLEVDANVR